MVNIAVTAEPPIAAANVAEDCRAAGLEVTMQEEASERFFQAVLRDPPGLVLAVSASPSDMLLESAALLTKVAPCPFVLFTTDASPAKIERAAAAGIHSYVIDGYAPRRLRGIVQVALARFQHQQRQGERLSDLERDLRDRKQVERAKGLLMRSRGLTEEAAFALMRSLAMRRRLRVANVAEAVIALSIGAEAVNRSGQIRMLAQRIVRCHIQLAFDVQDEWAATNLRESRDRLDANIATLRRTVGDRGCGPDLDRLESRWAALQKALLPASATPIDAVDALADALTVDAETLAAFLETSASSPTCASSTSPDGSACSANGLASSHCSSPSTLTPPRPPPPPAPHNCSKPPASSATPSTSSRACRSAPPRSSDGSTSPPPNGPACFPSSAATALSAASSTAANACSPSWNR